MTLTVPRPRTRSALANRAAAPLDPVTQYATDVIEGRIVAGKLVKRAAKRHIDDLATATGRGLRFNLVEAQWWIDFFPVSLRHWEGPMAGQPVILEPWQVFVVGCAFGWQRWSPEYDRWVRRFRLIYVEVAKKNGKSLIAAGFGLGLAFFDNEQGAQVYACATKRDQAKIVWNSGRLAVKKSPALSRRIQTYIASSTLVDPSTNSKFAPLGKDSDTDQGINVHGAILDELHIYPDRELWDNIRTATAARIQPMRVVVTTAGVRRESIWWDIRQDVVSVVEGRSDDDTIFGYIATLDDGDDPFDEAVWPKANPNLGVSVSIETLRQERDEARRMPGAMGSYLRFRMNMPTSVATRAIDIEEWDAGNLEPIIPEGAFCYAGMDLASTTDISAFVLVHRDELDNWNVLARFWCPEDGIDARSKRDGVPYRQWVDEGFLTATPGDMIDNEFIFEEIISLATEFFINEIGFDPWNALDLSVKLRQSGATVFQILQTAAGLGPAWLELQRAILDHRIRHGGNPILRWMAGNVEVETDAQGRQKPSKTHSSEKIDGMAALTMAVARLISAPEPAIWTAV